MKRNMRTYSFSAIAIWLFSANALLCVPALAAPGGKAPIVGYVLDLSGHWEATGPARHTLEKGGALRDGEGVHIKPPFQIGDFISLVEIGEDTPLIRLLCREKVGCDELVTLGDFHPEGPTRASVILEAVMALWRETKSDLYVTLGSRTGSAPLQEAVVETEQGRADLRPAFAGLALGAYRVRLQPVHEIDREGFGVVESEVKIEPEGQPVWIEGLPPGLYTLEVRSSSQAAGPGELTWVLLASPSSYSELARQFAEALAMTQKWDTMARTVVHEFLRAHLDHLARGEAMEGPP